MLEEEGGNEKVKNEIANLVTFAKQSYPLKGKLVAIPSDSIPQHIRFLLDFLFSPSSLFSKVGWWCWNHFLFVFSLTGPELENSNLFKKKSIVFARICSTLSPTCSTAQVFFHFFYFQNNLFQSKKEW